MAGAGFDAAMIRDAAARSRTGSDASPTSGRVGEPAAESVQGQDQGRRRGWYKGKATCILLGNVGELFAGVEAFEDARPDDGMLELGVVNAEGLVQWTRTLARTAIGTAADRRSCR